MLQPEFLSLESKAPITLETQPTVQTIHALSGENLEISTETRRRASEAFSKHVRSDRPSQKDIEALHQAFTDLIVADTVKSVEEECGKLSEDEKRRIKIAVLAQAAKIRIMAVYLTERLPEHRDIIELLAESSQDPAAASRLYYQMATRVEERLFLLQAERQREVYRTIFKPLKYWISPKYWHSRKLTPRDIEDLLKTDPQAQSNLLMMQMAIGLRELPLDPAQDFIVRNTRYQQLMAKMKPYLQEPMAALEPIGAEDSEKVENPGSQINQGLKNARVGRSFR